MTSQISKFEQADSNLTEQGIIKKVKRDKIKVKSPIKNIKNALISNKNSPKSGLKRSMRDRSRLASQTNRNTDNTDRNKKADNKVQSLILNLENNVCETPKKSLNGDKNSGRNGDSNEIGQNSDHIKNAFKVLMETRRDAQKITPVKIKVKRLEKKEKTTPKTMEKWLRK